MLLITTNHYSMHKHTKHKKVIFFFPIQKAQIFQAKQKATNLKRKKIYIAGTLPFFLPVKYPKSQGKNTIEEESLIQKYLT